MKKYGILLLILALISSLTACGGAKSPKKKTLHVFAAASLTEALTEIEKKYEAAHGDVDLVFTFDSSGTLKTQIEEGASCDVFISAASKQMNDLEEQNLVSKARVDLLENRVALCVAEGNPAGIHTFDELAVALKKGDVLLAVGNADVPVGQYTQRIFAHYGLDEAAIASCLTYGSNVKEVTTAVVEATADCGVIYATDAFSAGLTPADTATAEMCGRVIYPAAVMSGAALKDEALTFLDYLMLEEASAIFAGVGFTPLR